MRYDYKIENFVSSVHLGCILILLKSFYETASSVSGYVKAQSWAVDDIYRC